MPQPDPSSVEGLTESIADQLAEQVAAQQARVVELGAGGATTEDAALIGGDRGRHGFLTEIQL